MYSIEEPEALFAHVLAFFGNQACEVKLHPTFYKVLSSLIG